METASCSFSFQCFAMFSASGSSGFGALNSAWMLGAVAAALSANSATRASCKSATGRGDGEPQKHRADLQRRAPLILQDVEADASQLVLRCGSEPRARNAATRNRVRLLVRTLSMFGW